MRLSGKRRAFPAIRPGTGSTAGSERPSAPASGGGTRRKWHHRWASVVGAHARLTHTNRSLLVSRRVAPPTAGVKTRWAFRSGRFSALNTSLATRIMFSQPSRAGGPPPPIAGGRAKRRPREARRMIVCRPWKGRTRATVRERHHHGGDPFRVKTDSPARSGGGATLAPGYRRGGPPARRGVTQPRLRPLVGLS